MASTKLELLTCLLALTSVVDGDGHQGCAVSVEGGVDLFPIKVRPMDSAYWDIEYFDTYKIVTNKAVNESYLLYQCGTEVPTGLNVSEFATVVQIPVETVGLTQTPMITFMEQIGARDKIGAFLSDASLIWSPCFSDAVLTGEVALAESRTDGETPDLVGDDPPDVADMVAFASDYETPPFSRVIKVSEYLEKTNAAIFEWVKFYSAFFNLEETAEKVVLAAENRFACVKNKTSQAVTDSAAKPTLLWGYYSDYCGGWDVGECPNYYCEFAQACSIDILNSTNGTNAAAIALCSAPFMTTEEFVEFGKDADYWFYPADNVNHTLTTFSDELSVFKSVQDKKVYDYQGMGKNSWFEQRVAEYYNVLEDMCLTVGTAEGFQRRHFWRDVFTEQVPPDGLDGECTAEKSANILGDSKVCFTAPAVPTEAPATSPGTTTPAPNTSATETDSSAHTVVASFIGSLASSAIVLMFYF